MKIAKRQAQKVEEKYESKAFIFTLTGITIFLRYSTLE